MEDICRVCLQKQPPQTCSSISPENDDEKTSCLLEMLSYCIPEMDLYLVLNPVMCKSCIKSLKHAFEFKNKCLKNEEIFLKYLSKQSQFSKVDLNCFCKNVQSAIYQSITNNNKVLETSPITEVESDKQVEPVSNKISNSVTMEVVSKYKKRKCKRYRHSDCFGCKNRIRDATYHSKTISKNYICYLCGKTYQALQDLRKHMYSGVHFRRTKCNVCGKKMRDNSMLEVHMRTHTGEKPFECPLCQKTFRQNYTLTQHMRIHSKEKDNKNKCHICDKVLSSKYNLKIHMMQHTKSKPKCDICGKTFYTQCALDKHSSECSLTVKVEDHHICEEVLPEFVILKEEIDVQGSWQNSNREVENEYLEMSQTGGLHSIDNSNKDAFVEGKHKLEKLYDLCNPLKDQRIWNI